MFRSSNEESSRSSSETDMEFSSKTSSSSSAPVIDVSVLAKAERCLPMLVSTCTSTPVICHWMWRSHLAFSSFTALVVWLQIS